MLIIYLVIALLFGLLSIATIAAHCVASAKQLPDLKPRIVSWWVILSVFSLALLINGPLLFLLLCFVSFMGLKEYISVIHLRQSDRLLIFIAYLAIPIQYALSWYHHLEFVHFSILFCFISFALIAVIFSESKGMLASVAAIYWGLVLTTFCLSYLAYMNTIQPTKLCPLCGLGLVLYLIVLTQLNDVAQYCWGKLIGGKKIIPAVSPNKTRSGFYGGVMTTMLLSLPLGAMLVSFSIYQALLAGFLIGVGGFFGDILISAIKRDIGIKDFSALIPGHGGMLDRIDSLILTAPVFFYFLKFSHFPGVA